MKIQKHIQTPTKIFHSDSIKSDFSKFHKYLNFLFSTWHICPCISAISGMKSFKSVGSKYTVDPVKVPMALCNICNKVRIHNPYYILVIEESTLFVCLISFANHPPIFLQNDQAVTTINMLLSHQTCYLAITHVTQQSNILPSHQTCYPAIPIYSRLA